MSSLSQSRLIIEIRWLLQLAMMFFLLLVLVSYDWHDPSWTHAIRVDHIANWGGRVGAWVADLLFFLFGFSSYWWVMLLIRRIIVSYQRMTYEDSDKQDSPMVPSMGSHSHWLTDLFGFALILIASTGMEAMHIEEPLFSTVFTPTPGGVLGHATANGIADALGLTGGISGLLLVFAIGLSLFFRFSWINLAKSIGRVVILAVLWIKRRHVEKRDRKVGEAAALRREGAVEEGRVRIESHEPVQIIPAPTELLSAQSEVPASEPEMSERSIFKSSEKEQQEAEQEQGQEQGQEKRRETEQKEEEKGEAGQPLDEPVADSQAVVHRTQVTLPPLTLLDLPLTSHKTMSAETLEFTSRLIEKKLKDFGVTVKVVAAYPGPVITRYEIELATGVKGSQIVNLAKDLARSLSLVSIRVVETIPGKNYMGLELPNQQRKTVHLSEVLDSEVYRDAESALTLGLGTDIGGKPVIANLAKMPHLLVAGTTGSGKSVGINGMILSLLFKATLAQVRMILIDPKMLEMSVYEGIPHLLCPVVTDMQQAGHALNWTVAEMERRYKLMSKLGVRNLDGYNSKIDDAAEREEKIPHPFSLTPDAPEPLERLPNIVVVIDELADLMMVVGKKVEELIARIAQKARAAGIHLVLATQRPSVDVITGLIKANVPTRIAFQVSSKIDSRTILDQQGAESLLGMGDMLYLSPGMGVPTRVHGAFVSDNEVHRVVEKLKEHGEPAYVDGILEGGKSNGDEGWAGSAGNDAASGESDAMYDQAVEIVVKNRRASISLVQRHLRIGYNRAARLLEQMEQSGLVSAMGPNGNREILVPNHDAD